ncbi:hypothetical protein ACJIZ3_024197 [Penstemon smallii]|uniref:Two-component response regulator-like APRR7 n=1 Tax=Penstemon smallii TaxID=265156 RepID=A0ABD3TSI4_9LAMI
MNIEASGEKELPDEDKGIKHGVLGEKQSSFPVSELKVDAANKVDKAGAISGLHGPSILQVQQQQQQPQGSVCWERFLHVESIRVLLVENDDSTRHVVTALLRNCNYEVLEAANGLQAWKILEDLTNRIDLVLTEVVMPCLPGIPLLSKIMSHKMRKNIPVIMMSSHDSMGLVFKCLSEGAVDFLVKPIRKNELKNLWQHVWRRCHSSSGSGSESGTQTQKSVKSKSGKKPDNGGSDDGENDVSNGLNVSDGSDDGSGAQSSWTKQAVEVNNFQAMSPIDHVAESPDSTCAQVIRSNADYPGHKRVHISVARGDHEQKHDTVAECKDLDKITPTNVEPKANSLGIPLLHVDPKLDRNTIIKQIDVGQSNSMAECLFRKHKCSTDEMSNPLIDSRPSDPSRELGNILDNNATGDSNELSLELSLKRLRGVQDTGRPSVQDDRYVLRRSEQSAFSRYKTSSNIFKAPNGITSSSYMIENSVEVALEAHSTDRLLYPSSNGVSNNLDMGSTTNKLPAHSSIMKDKSEATSTINCLHASSLRPVKNDLSYSHPQVSHLLHSDIQTTDLGPVRGSNQELEIQHPHHHHFNNLEQKPSSKHDELSLKKLAVDAPHCGSINALDGTTDDDPRNYSLNRSTSASNYGSNGQHGSSTVVNASVTNVESDVGQTGKSGNEDASGSGSGNRIVEDKLAHRLAALNKFRQKKKDRCFAKKVRYQNRKKLAEQRPRVRGQFVKQNSVDSSNRTADD